MAVFSLSEPQRARRKQSSSDPSTDVDAVDPVELEATKTRHPAAAAAPQVSPPRLVEPVEPVARSSEQVWIDAIHNEVDDYLVGLRQLTGWPPEQVFGWLSSVSARLLELRIQCWRRDSRRTAMLRSHEIDPLIDQCDRAFRLHSRIQATREMDLKLSAGQVS